MMAARSQLTSASLEKTVDGDNWGNACRFLDPQTDYHWGGTVHLWPTASMAVSQMKSVITSENPLKVYAH